MAVKVNNLQEKQAVCECGAELTYTQKDVKKLSSHAGGEYTDEGFGIKCPSCKEWLATSNQGTPL